MRVWFLIVLLGFHAGCADASSPEAPVSKADVKISYKPTESEQAGIDVVIQSLEQAFSGIPIDDVSPSPMQGWWTVRVGGEFLEVSPDGRYVLSGTLFDLGSGVAVNVTDKRAGVLRAELLSVVPESEQIVFKAKNEKHKVYVFTDHTCGFCRTLHEQVKGYNDLGISIHYLAFPRGGPDAASTETLVQVWCAADRKAAITEAKAAGKLSKMSPVCDAPVSKHYELGRELGIRGTPAIFTVTGESIPGYRAPKELLSILQGG